MSQDEALVVAKVEELMNALDQVKKYRALSKLMRDFAIIVLSSVATLLGWELAFNFYKLQSGYPCYYSTPSSIDCTPTGAAGSPFLELIAIVMLFVFPAIAILAGILWVDRRLGRVRTGEWREPLREGFPGALKLLQELNWDSILEDIRVSKIGYSLYIAVKVVGYWIAASILLIFPYEFALYALHLGVNFYAFALISLLLVLALSWGDIEKRYRQVVSLDDIVLVKGYDPFTNTVSYVGKRIPSSDTPVDWTHFSCSRKIRQRSTRTQNH